MHGYSGPIKVSYGGIFTNIAKEFLKLAAEYDTTRVSCDDPNGLYSCDAYAVRLEAVTTLPSPILDLQRWPKSVFGKLLLRDTRIIYCIVKVDRW
jgi:hypothetical protein